MGERKIHLFKHPFSFDLYYNKENREGKKWIIQVTKEYGTERNRERIKMNMNAEEWKKFSKVVDSFNQKIKEEFSDD